MREHKSSRAGTQQIKTTPSGKSHGFTLIEVIMIIIISAIAIPVLLVIMGQSARLGVQPELQVTSANLGQALMEEIRSRDFASLSGFSNTITIGGVTYTQSVEVCNVPANSLDDTSACSSPSDYKRIRVSVSSSSSRVELVTLRTNY